MSDNMKIGATFVGLAYLSTFFYDTRDREPRAGTIRYANHVNVGSGIRPGSGWLTQKWTFGRLTEHYWDHLMAFKNIPVWITTRKNDGTYANYTAIMIIPDEEPEHFAGRVLNAELTFRVMVAL